ncbi:MAG: hypothetical protein AB1656_26355 [Candidatus Omnitrophota bacterium]
MDKREIMQAIDNAGTGGLIYGGVLMFFTFLGLMFFPALETEALDLIDVFLIFALSWGIFSRSRLCALALFVYLFANFIIVWIESGRPRGILFVLAFGYCFFQGVRGSFAYHRLLKENQREKERHGDFYSRPY